MQATGEMDKSKVRADVKKVLGFRMELNYRLSAWDRLESEPDPFVLANLLLTWMEHLKSPILDQVRNAVVISAQKVQIPGVASSRASGLGLFLFHLVV